MTCSCAIKLKSKCRTIWNDDSVFIDFNKPEIMKNALCAINHHAYWLNRSFFVQGKIYFASNLSAFNENDIY